ncbi:hypothetical protein EsH8_XV_000044 [Colletotrichum jinshuiense]
MACSKAPKYPFNCLLEDYTITNYAATWRCIFLFVTNFLPLPKASKRIPYPTGLPTAPVALPANVVDAFTHMFRCNPSPPAADADACRRLDAAVINAVFLLTNQALYYTYSKYSKYVSSVVKIALVATLERARYNHHLAVQGCSPAD